MGNVTVLGIDLAKNSFQLHGNNQAGKCVLKKKLRRSQLAIFVANLPKCVVAMEANQVTKIKPLGVYDKKVNAFAAKAINLCYEVG